jgi:SET domain-containing protein
MQQAVVFGLGSMFNHSRVKQNVGWTRDKEHKLIRYRALRDIESGEELCKFC